MTAVEDAKSVTQSVLAAEFLSKLKAGADILSIPPPEPLVGTWLDQGMLAELNGQYGSGKTMLALDLGLCVATGEPFHGQPIHRTGQVLYVMAEGAYTAPDRVMGWVEAHRQSGVPDDFIIYPDRFDLTDHASWAPLRSTLELGLLAPVLMVLDTRSRLTSGDENDKVPTERLIAACDQMRALVPTMTILIIHHPGHGKGGRGRGHSSFEQDLDVVWSMQGQLKNGRVTVIDQKQKARATNRSYDVGLTLTESGFPILERLADRPVENDAAEKGTDVAESLLEFIRLAPLEWTARDLAKEPPERLKVVGTQRARADALKKLVDGGDLVEVRKTGKAKYLMAA